MSTSELQQLSDKLKYPCLLFGMLALTYVIYLPGLSGGFLFDDYANLPTLGAFGSVEDPASLWAYLSGGVAGPGGRPVALLSFLLNDNAWPSDAYSFKYTNLLIHLLNGLFLFVLIRQLLALVPESGSHNRDLVALLASAFWLLNPYLVSTTLFVVQRMTQLSCAFVLLGLISHVYGRQLLTTSTRRGYVWMSLSIPVFTSLATLSKENGILLPALIACLELVLFRSTVQPRINKQWLLLFIAAPILVIIAYIVLRWPDFQSTYETRNFSLYERLLTEPGILLEYVYQLFIPHSHTRGLFHDSYPVATGILSPPYTLFSIILLTGLTVLVPALMRKHAYISLAIAFFLVGHSLESTVLPLELYFEHRNYLPSVFLFLPIAILASNLAHKKKKLFLCAICLYLAIYGLTTWQRASLWGDTSKLYLIWASENPQSRRAQRAAAISLTEIERPDLAMKLLEDARLRIGNDIYLQIHYLVLKCTSSRADQNTLNETKRLAAQTPYSYLSYPLLERFAELVKTGKCAGVNNDDALSILDKLTLSPIKEDHGNAFQQLYQLIASLYLQQDQLDLALQAFLRARQENPQPDVYLSQIAMLATRGHFSQAQELGRSARRYIESRGSALPDVKRSYYLYELNQLLTQIEKDQVIDLR